MDEITEDLLLRFWGKSDKDDQQNYHPLLFHLLDVGHAALLLWREALPDAIKRRIAAALGLETVEEAEQLVVLLAAQHDLGKASAFQLKASVPPLAKRVETAGFTIELPKEQPHGYVTSKTLPDFAERGVGGWQAASPTAMLLAKITGGHHGTFPTSRELKDITAVATGKGNWDALRAALLETVARVLYPHAPTVTVDRRISDAATIPLIGGFISVADWLGSSKKHFEPAGPLPLAQYAALSRERAKKALEEYGWTRRPHFAPPAAFGELFHDAEGNPFNPNPMQEEVMRRADAATKPYLLIIEAAMGEGKTEAAFYAIDRALSTGLASGFFAGMPTQATGNAMFLRALNDYLTPRGHGGRLNLQLVHAGNFLSDVFDKLQLAANAPGDDERESRIVAESWFTHKKQALLAPFGVGTIDQSLMSVLQTRHWFVRLFGLAGKVVVFDEVHAYDVYMSALLVRLLGWLRLLGCTVILLSATLPELKRRELIAGWDRDAQANETAYPRVTYVGDGAAEAVTTPSDKKPKDVDVSYADNDLTALAERLRDDLPDGGCTAVICNTVTRAQAAYDVFCKEFGEKGWEITLFHARTLAGWRKKREEEVEAKFGKKATRKNGKRPAKAILIATQVAEQSLDLDFDWMASEIAPVDLLLQRMGRLWRHERKDRPIAAARFVVLCGEGEDGLPVFPDWCELIYERYILLRSRLALAEGMLRLPDKIESLIRAVYDDPAPEGLPDAWTAALDDSRDCMQTQADNDAAQADKCLVRPAHRSARDILSLGEEAGDTRLDLKDDEDPDVHPTVRAATRLGDPSITVVCRGTDADGEPLARKTAGTPTTREARELLGFAVSLSNRGLYFALKDQKTPPGWEDSSYLRWHRALDFDHGVCKLDDHGYTLQLSRERGLIIVKEGEKTEE